MTNSLLKVLVTGGSGQLGQALAHHPRAKEVKLIPCARPDLDITNPTSIANAFAKFEPDLIINAAAYTAVDKAEEEFENADSVNHLGAKNIAKACAEHHIPLIHISTDYIFDGTKNAAYVENDTPNPLNMYGKTKWLGEQAVRENCKEHIILRVSGVFSEHGQNFFKTMLKLSTNPDLKVVSDQITCPTYAGDIANTIYTIIKKLDLKKFGTYHYCSTPETSWHHFAEVILHREIKAITTDQYPTAAKRPSHSVLDCQKIISDYAIQQPSWERAIWTLQ